MWMQGVGSAPHCSTPKEASSRDDCTIIFEESLRTAAISSAAASSGTLSPFLPRMRRTPPMRVVQLDDPDAHR
jgi:hypothetical protein